MKKIRERKSWIVLIAVLLLFAACKGESPTAPPPGGGSPVPPPSGTNVTVTTSNPNPLVDSTVTVTATVTLNNQPVPNGTAVEFTTSAGVLNGGGTETIKTTTNGIATVTLTSGSTGPIRVTVTVNNITRTADVTFQARPVDPQPPNTTPTISSVTPPIGRPQGGEVITITGTNFKAPVRVLFNTGGAVGVEASVQSVTTTKIEVISPPVNLGAGQQLVADVIVLTQAGSAAEQRVEASDSFTFRNEQLQPRISTISPNSGPVTGGTRVTIFGDGFQEPVQVLFNTAEARVLNVQYDRINVETPAGRDTDPSGEGPVLGPVTVTVRNINSQLETDMAAGFHYKNAVQITAIGPTQGPFTGGTRIEIDGVGFVSPVTVTVAGVAAQPIFVSGTRVIAITSPIAVDDCGDQAGPVVVTNINNGDGAEGPEFTYEVLEPVIINVSTSATPGGVFNVTVLNAIGTPRITLGDTALIITGATDNGDGSTTFATTIPTTVDLDTEECDGVAGAQAEVATAFDVTFTSLTTGCTDTLNNGAVLAPAPNTPELAVVPAVFAPFSASITADADPVTPGPQPTVAPSEPQTVNLTNTGTGTLTINTVTPGGSCANFSIVYPPVPSPLATCDPFPIIAVYNGQTTPTTETCTISVSTTAGNRTLTLIGTSR